MEHNKKIMEDIYFENKKGSIFYNEFKKNIEKATDIYIATGYFGLSAIEEFKDDIISVGKKGSCIILFGMEFRGNRIHKAKIRDLDRELRLYNKNNGVYVTQLEYHGKIYKFKNLKETKYFFGSSNFSLYGLKNRIEATALINDKSIQSKIDKHLDNLLNDEKYAYVTKLEEIDFKKIKSKDDKSLSDCEINESEFPSSKKIIGEVNIKLRADDWPRSSLNLYFDKGRKNSKTSKYAPRPWYEVELSATTKEINDPFYPQNNLRPGSSKARRGEFVLYATDKRKYYKIHMKVFGDGGKNISSSRKSGGRNIFGELIKGKLERKNLIEEGSEKGRITNEVLESYGNNYIKFKKIDKKEYILEF